MGIRSFDNVIDRLRQCALGLPDLRTGANTQYSMYDFVGSAFSVFFTQSPSFLSHQKKMEMENGHNNARSLFGIQKFPTANQIRNILDPLPKDSFKPVYSEVHESMEKKGVYKEMEMPRVGQLIALDATHYFSSKTEHIHCSNCSCKTHSDGSITHFHSVLTPVVVAPGNPLAIPLFPEFIVPQDGHVKQDCEISAAKRWLTQASESFASKKVTILGDDLYSHQPFCRQALLHGFHFILVCKPSSHHYLSQWVNQLEVGKDLHIKTVRSLNSKKQWETVTYRWANNVPLAEGEGALKVSWVEIVVTNSKNVETYRNSFATDWTITEDNVEEIALSGRTRWKIENENNNVLKNRGYHLEHNFGHGKINLTSILVSLNILAFLIHGFLLSIDEEYNAVRSLLPTRRSFFESIQALTLFLYFDSWGELIHFMVTNLKKPQKQK